MPRGPHTSSHPINTLGINNWGGGERDQSVSFLLDTGKTFSVLSEAPGTLSSQTTTVMGLSGRAKCYYFSHPSSCNWGSLPFSHEFLIVPGSPSPFLEKDVLGKVLPTVFMNMEPELSLPLVEQM